MKKALVCLVALEHIVHHDGGLSSRQEILRIMLFFRTTQKSTLKKKFIILSIDSDSESGAILDQRNHVDQCPLTAHFFMASEGKQTEPVTAGRDGWVGGETSNFTSTWCC